MPFPFEITCSIYTDEQAVSAAAKPYNFALSPILAQARQNCTLVAPFSKHPEDWLTRDYTEIHSGELVHVLGEYGGEKLFPQTLSGVLWRHYLHPEEKSLGPDGERCDGWTRGLLRRRPVNAIIPFNLIGKEVERRAQEGEDVIVLESTGPIRYQAGQRAKTRSADPGLIHRARRFGPRLLMRESGYLNTLWSASWTMLPSTLPPARSWNRRWRS